jgi:hypothetical protein
MALVFFRIMALAYADQLLVICPKQCPGDVLAGAECCRNIHVAFSCRRSLDVRGQAPLRLSPVLPAVSLASTGASGGDCNASIPACQSIPV